MERPQFKGNPHNEQDLFSFEQQLRAWEEAKAEAAYYDELHGSEERSELACKISEYLGDPCVQERFRGEAGLPGMNGAPGKPGKDGEDGTGGTGTSNFDDILTTCDGDVVANCDGNLVVQGDC